MHVVTLLKSDMFDIDIAGTRSTFAELMPDWNAHDRFGLVIDDALGGLGASHLLQAAMSAFYDVKPSRRNELTVYPEIYAFHIGKGHGTHAPFDFWPARREVILETADHRAILDAINDRGITRLAVPDRPMLTVEHRPKEEDTAIDRIASAFAYDPGGRVRDADIVIRGNSRKTEFNPSAVLRATEVGSAPPPAAAGRPVKELENSYADWLTLRAGDTTVEERAAAKDRRDSLRDEEGLVRESYRRIGVSEALKRLAGAGAAQTQLDVVGR